MASAAAWRGRFDAFVADKTRRAIAATLPPYVTDCCNPPGDALAIGNAWTRALFDGAFYVSPPRNGSRPHCSLVFVQSVEGNTGTDDPAALGGGAIDKHVIYEGLSRVAADAVLAGASTVRGADLIFSVWHPELVRLRQSLDLPRHPVQLVATRRGLDLDSHLLFNVPELRVLILTSGDGAETMREQAATRPWVRMVVMEGSGDLRQAFTQLRALGLTSVSCVGGRKLAAQLLDADLVDDLYLTTSPRGGAEPNTPIHPDGVEGPVVLRKHGTGPERGVVFEHITPR